MGKYFSKLYNIRPATKDLEEVDEADSANTSNAILDSFGVSSSIQSSSANNNQMLVDSKDHQKLTSDEINSMKKEMDTEVRESRFSSTNLLLLLLLNSHYSSTLSSFSLKTVVKKIVNNSATFESKTDFAKAKYIKKKLQK